MQHSDFHFRLLQLILFYSHFVFDLQSTFDCNLSFVVAELYIRSFSDGSYHLCTVKTQQPFKMLLHHLVSIYLVLSRVNYCFFEMSKILSHNHLIQIHFFLSVLTSYLLEAILIKCHDVVQKEILSIKNLEKYFVCFVVCQLMGSLFCAAEWQLFKGTYDL